MRSGIRYRYCQFKASGVVFEHGKRNGTRREATRGRTTAEIRQRTNRNRGVHDATATS